MSYRSLHDGPPAHAHLQCLNGYWWPADINRQGCFGGTIHATVEHVEAVFTGPVIWRAEALAALAPGAQLKLFPHRCGCGSAHRKMGQNLLRAHRQIVGSVRSAIQDLNAVEIFTLAAIQRATPRDTECAQAECAASFILARGPRGRRTTTAASIAA